MKPSIFVPLLLHRHTKLVLGEVNKLNIPKNVRCSSSQFFDSVGLQCTDCDADLHLRPDASLFDPHGNPLRCTCEATYVQEEEVGCLKEEMRSGTCNGFLCSARCEDSPGMVASRDRRHCIACGGTNIFNGTSSDVVPTNSTYDASTKTCTCANPLRGSSEERGAPLMSRSLVEVYDANSGDPIWQGCAPCPRGTAVITSDLFNDDESALNTAGRTYEADPFHCASCPDPNMFFDSDYSCVCRDGFTLVGEPSLGKQSCIESIPSVSIEYSRVKLVSFDSAISEGGIAVPVDAVTVDSVAFRHHYLRAASLCEYFRGADGADEVVGNGGSLAACQTLGNLCVMTMYDESSAACRQFQTVISQERVRNYNAQEDWKYGLPWLFYVDEADDVAEDRGLNMRMALSDGVSGHTHRMSYKVASYSLDGMFLGIDDLSTQFDFCRPKKSASSAVRQEIRADVHPVWLNFGSNYRREFSCDVNALLDQDMVFYDIYVVDAGDTSCSEESGGHCLYPVPVLHRNFVESGSFPNKNSFKEDERNDRYARRFFLFDNMSGRSTSGDVVAVRYAKKIVLQTMIQTEDPSKIYPPKLIIEYGVKEVSLVTDNHGQDHRFAEDVIFKAEYTMNTARFWTSVEVMIGFVSAIGFVVWVLRAYNWQNRNRSTLGRDEECLFGIEFFIHVLMLVFHTLVILVFPCVFAICLFWFVFFKFQGVVFLLLPSDSEFYDVGNEYFFFTSVFYGLFGLHTIHILYVIYRQVRVDVFLLDWERPKGRHDSVSLWRTVLLANEWNRMQSRRKICIEWNLFFISLCAGAGLIDNTTNAHPGFESSPGAYPNTALRFAVTVLVWGMFSFVQWTWNFLFYERYVSEPHSQRFIDLCTVAKISVFILDEAQHGFYLHCRSPYAFADCSMHELLYQLDREANGLTMDRGLDAPGCPRNAQAFELFASSLFRRQIQKIFSPIHPRLNAASGRQTMRETVRERMRLTRRASSKGGQTSAREKAMFARKELNAFLQSFVEQSPPPQRDGLRRVVRKPLILERILGTPPADIRTKDPKCVLHLDEPAWIQDYSFLQTTFLGIEPDLLLHDILTFNVVDMVFQNTAISVLVTYLQHLLRTTIRSRLGRANLVRKAFVDDKFLF